VDIQGLGRLLIVIGALIALLGLALALGGRLGLGQLPGDIAFRRGRVSIYVPITTAIILSIVLTIVLNLVLRR
jgi:uncharacterized membrane protein YidH (DUF202 family)